MAHLANLIANEVSDGLSKKCLKRTDVTRFERVESSEDAQHRLLDQILGLILAPCKLRQTSMGPAAQRRNASLDQYIDGRAVAFMRSLQQLEND